MPDDETQPLDFDEPSHQADMLDPAIAMTLIFDRYP